MKLCTGAGIDGNGCMGLLRDTDPDTCKGCQIIVSPAQSVEDNRRIIASIVGAALDFAEQVAADATADRYPLD